MEFVMPMHDFPSRKGLGRRASGPPLGHGRRDVSETVPVSMSCRFPSPIE